MALQAAPSIAVRRSTAIGPFDRFTNYNASSYNGRPGLVPSTQLGGAIKPERQREIEVGADVGFWSNRLGVELTYYDQHIDDLLLMRTLSPSTGHARVLQNVGTMSNKGWELLVRTIPNASIRGSDPDVCDHKKPRAGIEGGVSCPIRLRKSCINAAARRVL